MTVKDIVAVLCTRHGITQEELATRLEYKGQSSIAMPLSRDGGMGMKTSTLVRWIEELDCQVIIQSIDGEDLILDGDEEGVEFNK